MNPNIKTAFALAKQQYAALGVDVNQALTTLATIPVSMHCWQGDDVGGFEADAGALTGGIQATGNYPGKARDAIELRRDLDLAMSLIRGPSGSTCTPSYLEAESPVTRDKIEPKHFANWVRWAKERRGSGLQPSCFSHPLSADGMTLSHPDPEIRRFWIDHCKAGGRISASFGQALGTPSVMNIWIPDGMKDLPADRLGRVNG